MRTAEEIKSEIDKITSDIYWYNLADRLTPYEQQERSDLFRRLYELQDEMDDITRAQEGTHE